jgi:GTP pyrophosphokinase
MNTIDIILKKCKENNFKTQELDLISRANKLLDNYDKKEENLNLALIVANLNADATTILTAFLYNLNDYISLDEIRGEFGKNVANLIDNLVKMENLKLNDYTEISSIYLRKVLVGLSEDVRVLIIKLAERLLEMRNADALNDEEKKQIINETMNVLIPIAHRLGINSIKSELEDLCLKYSKPDVYNEILEKLDGTREELSLSLEEMKNSISEILTEHRIKFKVKSRVKSVYSIYNKLSNGKKWNEIYDILAMRLIVDTAEDCYLAIGLIHSKYRPIPKRFKDYIAMPKENMYQSLHTSVFGVDGYIFEIQIRTPEMDEIAEHGIASHWSYKEHGTKVVQNLMEQKLEIFRNTIDLAKKEESDEVFAKSMESELLSKLIYVFTPKGDVLELPYGATPIDFAYRIHSDIGDKTVGAIVNNTIVPLDYELQDGDIIKINTNSNSKPNQDWLRFVKTAQAKNKIKAYFSKIDRSNYIEQGRELLEKELRKQKLSFNDLFTTENINKILSDLKLKDLDDLYISIGSLRYTSNYIISLINEDKKNMADIMLGRVNKKTFNTKENYKNDIIVAGTDDILVNIAKCCRPVPGDEIIGYITKGEGVSVHKKDCPNIKNFTSRLIDVKWNETNNKLFLSNLTIKTNSNKNHLLDLVTCASTRGISINSVNEYENDEVINYQMSVKVQNKNELSLFLEDIRNLNFVIEVIR